MWSLLLGTCLIFIFVLYKIYNYLKAPKLQFPGPDYYPFFGAFFEFVRNKNRFYDWALECVEKYNKNGIIYFSMPMKDPYILLLKPEYVKHVLSDNMNNYHREPVYKVCNELLGNGIFNVDGQLWHSQRKISAHIFKTSQLNDKIFKTFVNCSDKLINIINDHVINDNIFDLKELFFNITLDSICRVAFDFDITGKHEFVKAIDYCTRYLFHRLMNPLWQVKKITNMKDEAEYHRNIKILNEICYEIINERKSLVNENNQDLLSLFIKAGCSDEKYLRDIVFSFIIAGRDTTASSLSWLFYELFKNPIINDEINEELAGLDINNLTATDYKSIKLINNAFLETLRLHPPVPMDIKFAKTEDNKFPDNIIIPKNAIVVYSPYIFGRLKEIWGNDYNKFRPDRWFEYETEQINQYKFLVFNAGPRICLGRYFAKLEAAVIIVKLLSKFKFIPQDSLELKNSIGVTSTIEGKLLVKAIKKVEN